MATRRSRPARRKAGNVAAWTAAVCASALFAVMLTVSSTQAQYAVNNYPNDCSVFRNPDFGTNFWSQHGLCYCVGQNRALRCDNLCTYTDPRWCYSPSGGNGNDDGGGGGATAGGTPGGGFEAPPDCDDGKDNDNDGKTDFPDDPGCASATDGSETSAMVIGRSRVCEDPTPSCGLDGPGGAEAHCQKQGKQIQWWTPPKEGDWCVLPNGNRGECFTCVGGADDDGDDGGDNGGNNGGNGGEPPPLCPIACQVDADCGDQPRCTMDANDPTKPACFQHEGACVKKCQVPKCVNNKCTMVSPPRDPVTGPYLACDGENACPPPRCGDGIVQAGGGDAGGDDGDDGGDDGNGAGGGDAPADPTILGCNSNYPLCGPLHSQACPTGQVPEGINIACTKGGAPGTCYRCVPYGDDGADVCTVPRSIGCAAVPDARACEEPSCVNVYGREIPNTFCRCLEDDEPTAPECQGGYYLPGGQFTPNRPAGCISLVSRGDGTCNCIMASVPSASPVAPVASLLATSIINGCPSSGGGACSPSFVANNCNPGEACFALIGASSTQQQCAPAECAGREEECGMQDSRWGSVPLSWEMCAGTAQPPKEPDDPENPDDPVPVPEGGEECDDGNNVGGDGCSPSCKKERCGDGHVQAKGADGKPNTADDEQCDDGNLNVGDGCGNTCKIETCGNGKRDWGEECDDGPENSDTKPGACRTNCMMPKCNDGVIDNVEPWGEQCDCGEEGANFDWEANKNDPMSPYCETEVDGKPAICHIGMCRVFYCGDGFVFNAGQDRESGTIDDEMCDSGPFNSNFPVGSGKCTSHAQCPGGICVENECIERSCQNDGDCAGGACIGGACKPGGCSSDAQCPQDASSGLRVNKCLEGSCQRCDSHSQCATGYCGPNGMCVRFDENVDVSEFTGACRLDCKPARCGDGIKDAGEKCDEGEKMMKCIGAPQPACDCAIPSWGSHTRPMGEPYNYTCCPADKGYCTVWGSDTCPTGCGVEAPASDTMCSDGILAPTHECDTAEDNPFGEAQYVYRPNRDGDRLSFLEDDGRWKAQPSSIEKKYTTIDHEPADGASEDKAWILTSGAGSARTYFHLWDVTAGYGTFTSVELIVTADFDGDGAGWKKQSVFLPFMGPDMPARSALTVAEMNAAILEIVADEDAHTLTFRLYLPSNGSPLSSPVTLSSPIPVTGRKPIAVDALKVVVRGAETDTSACKADCTLKRCGNGGMPEEGEECDDGNAESGDGCNNACRLEFCPAE